MDFALSVIISGLISSALILIALGVYYQRFKEVSEQLTTPTRKALSFFGIGIFFLALVGPTGLFEPAFVMPWIALFFASLITAQLYLSVDTDKKVRRLSILLFILALSTIVEAFGRVFIPSITIPIITISIITSFLVVSFIGAIYVLRESPSPFTASMLIIIIFTMISAMTAATGYITDTPQFFILQILPGVVAAAVVGSMLRPWRNIVTLTSLGLVVSVQPALIIPAYIANNMTIFLFSVTLMFALLCMIIPFSFFIQQAVETRSSTAFYITLALFSIGLLAITHGNNFAIANSAIGSWDEIILFFDWFLGVFGVCAFTMSAIASSFSVSVRHAARDILIGIGAGLLVLGHPFVRWVEVDVYNDGSLILNIQRWELDPLYIGIMTLLMIAFAVFFKLSYQLWKVGSGRAGLRFVFFMFAALFLGIVAMFADMIPLGTIVWLFLFAGVMLLLSSPRRNPFQKAS